MERNVVFNGSNIQEKENSTVMVGVQSEGEKDKVIQHPENITEVKNQTENVDKPQNKDEDFIFILRFVYELVVFVGVVTSSS